MESLVFLPQPIHELYVCLKIPNAAYSNKRKLIFKEH